MAQITLNSTGVASSGALVLQSNGTTTAVTISTGQVATLEKDAVVNGLTVGRGAGAVATNTAVGASALAVNTSGAQNTALGDSALVANTTGIRNTGIGYVSLSNNTTGSYNTGVGAYAGDDTSTGSSNSFVGYDSGARNTSGSNNTALGSSALTGNITSSNNTAVGFQALTVNTAANNTAVGYQAGYTNDTGTANTFVGGSAGYSSTGTGYNTFVGLNAGYSATGSYNTFIGSGAATGAGAGFYVTSGAKNTIIGGYNGNQGPLDIRTASNNIVLSDGDGNPRLAYVYTSSTIGSFRVYSHTTADSTNTTFQVHNAGGADILCEAGNNSATGISGVIRVAKITSNSRSINAAGTVNQNGADYAEYMVKSGSFTIAKGDVCGINAEGKLTNVFADAISFCVKSTDPGLVGGDSWFTEPRPKDENNNELTSDTQEYAAWFARMEAARATVDRIAFCGQVPVNVLGATSGQYIVPVNDNGAIKGEAVSNPTFEQYQTAVGKVIAIESDGRAKIIVKVA